MNTATHKEIEDYKYQMQLKEDAYRADAQCNFAWPGTYGHECGDPAKWSGSKPSDLTKSGIYHTRRCDKCKTIKGGENTGYSNWVPFNPLTHRNEWK